MTGSSSFELFFKTTNFFFLYYLDSTDMGSQSLFAERKFRGRMYVFTERLTIFFFQILEEKRDM